MDRWPLRTRLAMISLGFVPLLHVAVITLAVLTVPGPARLAAFLGVLYLMPPLAVRLLLRLRPVAAGTHAAGSPVFLTWWATAQCQMIFCRLTFLEELLRLVPSLYSCWLRLWGARIGRLTFWSPGLRILDRSFLVVGDDVVFGAGVRLNPHVLETADGRPVLHLAPVTVGEKCHVGGYSLLTAGTVVPPGQSLKAFTLSPPFTHWKEGQRVRPAVPRG